MKHTFTFFSSVISDINPQVCLDKDESFHAINVLRMKTGDTILIIDGNGKTARADIISLKNKTVTAEIKNIQYDNCKIKNRIIVSINDFNRLCTLVEKACELQTNEIILINEINENRLIRLNKIILASCKQSKNSIFPKIRFSTFNQFITNIDTEDTNIIADNNGKKITHYTKNIQNIRNIFVGAENGFTKDQITLLESKKNIKVKLGQNTLRTETAFIAILSQLLII